MGYQSELKDRVDYDTWIHWLQFFLVVTVNCDNQKIVVKRKRHKNKAWKLKKESEYELLLKWKSKGNNNDENWCVIYWKMVIVIIVIIAKIMVKLMNKVSNR